MELPENGRRVFVCTRTKSQTVNICDANNRRGDYDWIVRLFPPETATDADISRYVGPKGLVADPTSLVAWLEEEKHGEVEKEPPQDLPPDHPPGAADAPGEEEWIGVAVSIVEQAIDQLVREFLRVPYLHRVEHSLHARFYGILAAQPHFAREIPLQNQMFTQPLHKEWPETIPQENARRGNFDLAVLTPWQLRDCNIAHFREGRLRAPIVIEMGLDYPPAHLAADRDKLIHSRVPHGYLVHLTRCGPNDRANQIILDPGGDCHVKTAYACVPLSGGGVSYKLVNGSALC
jgi:hypothetical protein